MKKIFLFFIIFINLTCSQKINIGKEYLNKLEPEIKIRVDEYYINNNYDFKNLLKNEKKEILFEIKNIGEAILEINEMVINCNDSNAFKITKMPEKKIKPDATSDFIIQFIGISPGEKIGTLYIKSNAKEHTINIKGFVNLPEPEFLLTNAFINPDLILAKDLPKNITVNLQIQKLNNAIIDSIKINLSSINGDPSQDMFNNGTNGDDVSNDEIYSLIYEIPSGINIGNYILPITVIGNAKSKNAILNLKITELLFNNSDMENNVENININGFTVTYPTEIENIKIGQRSIRINGTVGNANADIFKISENCNSKSIFNKITFWIKGYSQKGIVIRFGANSSFYFNINDDTKFSLIQLSSSPVYSNKTFISTEWIKIQLNVSDIDTQGLQFILRGGSNANYDIYIDHIIFE